MTHWKKLFDERFVGAWDFDDGNDVNCTIESLKHEQMRTQEGDDVEKPVLYMKGAKKGLVLNKTNAESIAKLYGNDTDGWMGKKITLYPTTCKAFGQTVDCIRIRKPRAKKGDEPWDKKPKEGAKKPKAEPAPEPEHGDAYEGEQDDLPL